MSYLLNKKNQRIAYKRIHGKSPGLVFIHGLNSDMSGLKAYFKEMTNMERIFNELTWAIRNGHTVEKYLADSNVLNDANLTKDEEIREIAIKGFGDIATFLKHMLEIKENGELRKDYNACIEVITKLNPVSDDDNEDE